MNLSPLLTHNYEMKLVSVVVASLFWLYVLSGGEVETRVQVPVVYSGLADGLTLVEKPPEILDVEMRGSRLALLKLKTESPRAVLDLSGVRDGFVTFANLESAVQGVKGFRITRIYPGRIDLSVTSRNRK